MFIFVFCFKLFAKSLDKLVNVIFVFIVTVNYNRFEFIVFVFSSRSTVALGVLGTAFKSIKVLLSLTSSCEILLQFGVFWNLLKPVKKRVHCMQFYFI